MNIVRGVFEVLWMVSYAIAPVVAVAWLACLLIALHDEAHKRADDRSEK